MAALTPAVPAVADPVPQELTYACALKSNGLLSYAASPSACNLKTHVLVTFQPGPVLVCVQPDGSTRKANSVGACGKLKPKGTSLILPSNTPTYFCIILTNGARLRWVADPNTCTSSETLFVVVNHAPTAITLSNSSVAENQTPPAAVGTLSATDPDPGATFTFSLVAGAGSDDNASFSILGTSLRTAASFDYETQNSYSIRIRVTDQHGGVFEQTFTISVTDVPEGSPPFAMGLSNSSVAENQIIGYYVGSFLTGDPDAGDTHSYSLVSGVGDTDNPSFQIVNVNELRTAAVFDYETDSSYSVRVRTTDNQGGTYSEAFTITITNVNDAPTDISLSPSTVSEHQPSGTTVGTLSAADQDAGSVHGFSLVAGVGDTDNASFTIGGSSLLTAAEFDLATKSTYFIRVRADDGAGGTFEKSLTVTVTEINDAPTDVALSNANVAENQSSGTAIGTFTTTDPDGPTPHTYTLVAGPGDTDNASFAIVGGDLRTNAVFDYETTASYSIRVQTSDGTGTFAKAFTILVTNVNEAPTNIALSVPSVPENSSSGTTVGTLTSTDDAGDAHTYSLVSGTGDGDNSSFSIVGDLLKTAAVFDFETDSSYTIRVRSSDGSASFEKVFTISVTDANDAPSDIALTANTINENVAAPATVGTLSAADQDVSQTHTFSLPSTGCGGGPFADNSSFAIDNATLQAAVSFNYEADSSYTICLRTTDNGAPSLSFDEQFTVTILDVNDAPVATADGPYNGVIGNTLAVLGTTGTGPHVVLTGSLPLANDTDEDVPPQPLSAVAETVASAGGGSATILADGSFRFTPGVGDKNQNDTFTYRVTDGTATSAGTVTVGIADALVWYVDSASVAATNDGRSHSPLLALTALDGASGAGDVDAVNDVIFVYAGTGTYGDGLALEAGQKLLGESGGLTVLGHTLVDPGAQPVISNTAGNGVDLASGVDVQNLTVSGTSGIAIAGTNVSTATVGSGVYVGSGAGGGISLSGGSGNIAIAANITPNSVKSIAITGRTGGTVTFTGGISDNVGIALTNNTGATVLFTGQISLSTGAGAAFTATGGGAIGATHVDNNIATTMGRAINVSGGTTITADGLRFRYVNTLGAAPNSILLANTGTLGGLTITGTGTGVNSGGLIQGTTGEGISLTSVAFASLSNMTVQDTASHGIAVTNSRDLTLTRVIVRGAGDADNERAVNAVNLGGTFTISGGLYDDAADDLVKVENTNTNLMVVVGGARFEKLMSTFANNALQFVPNGTSAIDATVENSNFHLIRNSSVNLGAAAALSSGGSTLIFANNNVDGGPGGAGGILVSGQENTSTTTAIRSNTLNGSGGNGVINHDANDSSSIQTMILDNTITGAQGHAIVAGVDEDADIRALISGNTITNAGGDGIELTNFGDDSAAGMTSTASWIVRNNLVSGHSQNPAVAFVGAIAIFHFEDDTDTTCAAVTGNSVSGTPATYSDIYLQGVSTKFRFEEVPNDAPTGAVPASYVHSLNSPGTTAANIATSDVVYSDGTACPLP